MTYELVERRYERVENIFLEDSPPLLKNETVKSLVTKHAEQTNKNVH